jgi:predicted DNA-binding protein
MGRRSSKNFHVPLPEELYERLRREAERSGRPATELARTAIRRMLQRRERAALHDAIARYATERAGSASDLDRDLEAAGVEHLLSDDDG